MKNFLTFFCFLLANAAFADNAVTVDPSVRLGPVKERSDAMRPVRPIGVNGQLPWNERATLFLYPPTFGFRPIAGAKRYRFEATDGCGIRHVFEAAAPTASLADVWAAIPTGWVDLRVTGLSADGRAIGVAGERRFWKKAAFRPDAYPPARRPYADAAKLAYLNVLNSAPISHLRRTGDIDRTYPHNCYPAKMLASIIRGMIALAKMEPSSRQLAMETAEKAADWMLAHTVAAPSPLAGFPVTYDHHPEALNADPPAPARISKERASISMNIYPAEMGCAYAALYEADGKKKYLEGAKAISERYLALQGEDGTWWLDQHISDGKPVGKNRVVPIQNVIPLLDTVSRLAGESKYSEAARRAFAYIEKGPMKNWNWEGQFEDTAAQPTYRNLTKHDACSTAIYLTEHFPNDAYRLDQARELLRFAEDQFVFWEKPYTPDSEPTNIAEWNRPWRGKWECPSVTEQYCCYRPIDASAAKMIRTYLALYRATDDPLDLAKAKALGDMATRIQRDDGFIRTFWSDHPHVNADNWVNCMLATAEALAELGEAERKPKTNAAKH